MSLSPDELRTLRERQKNLADSLDRARTPPPASGPQAVVIKTTTITTYPTVIQAYYAVQAYQLGGTETEGGAISLTMTGLPFFAANIGSAIPPPNTTIDICASGDRYVFQFDG